MQSFLVQRENDKAAHAKIAKTAFSNDAPTVFVDGLSSTLLFSVDATLANAASFSSHEHELDGISDGGDKVCAAVVISLLCGWCGWPLRVW